MYQAIVTKLKNVRKHPNADRLQLADCYGYQVVIGLDSKEGDLGIYFPTDGRLSLEFCEANDLLAKIDPVTGERSGGFFDEKRKVKTQRFRGERSEGFWCPLEYLASFVKHIAKTKHNGEIINHVSESERYTYDPKTDTAFVGVSEGQQLTHFANQLICERYETPQTRRAARQNQGATRPKSIWFPEHIDTAQFLIELEKIPVGSQLYISEKLHGTSQREGNIYTAYELKWWQKLINRFWNKYPLNGYEHMIGTRRTILDDSKPNDWYNDRQFRFSVCVGDGCLKPGQIVYGEVVGFTTNGSPIMCIQPTSKTKDKTVIKQYGDNMLYSYGCSADDASKPQQDFYAYRIQYISPEIESKELNYDEFETECAALGIKAVPLLTSFEYDGDTEALKQKVIDLAEGPSTIDPSHIKEGVVLRIETPDGRIYFLKYKSFLFRVLEGIAKEDDSFQDIEEAS